MYEIKENTPFYNTLRTLITSAVYTTNYNKSHMIRFYILGFLLRCAIWIHVIAAIMHYYILRKEHVGINFSENFFIIFGGGAVILVCAIFPFTCKDWSKLLSEVTKFTTFGEPQNLNEHIKFYNRASLMFRNYCIGGGMVYSLQALTETSNCKRIRDTYNLNMICYYVVPMWLPYKVNTATELCICIYQAISITVAVTPGALICFLIWEVGNLIILHFHILKEAFPKILLESDKEKRKKLLRLWLTYHRRILRLAQDLNKLTKKCMGLYSLIAALIFGCISYQLATMYKPLGALFIFVGYLVALLLLCDAGQRVHDESLSVSNAVYCSSWYEQDVKTRNDILFIMMSSNINVRLDALPLGQLNNALVLMIMKGAYSYLTLLKQST